jgi:hypothetical protein
MRLVDACRGKSVLAGSQRTKILERFGNDFTFPRNADVGSGGKPWGPSKAFGRKMRSI